MHTSRAFGGIIASKKERTSCNCAEGHCYHPWSSDTPHFNPLDSKTNIANLAFQSIRKLDTSEGTADPRRHETPNLDWSLMSPVIGCKYLFPSRELPLIPEYYAACHFPETMPNVVDTDNPI
jgi:hypothetical protein